MKKFVAVLPCALFVVTAARSPSPPPLNSKLKKRKRLLNDSFVMTGGPESRCRKDRLESLDYVSNDRVYSERQVKIPGFGGNRY